MVELEDQSRQRLDFSTGPKGEAIATLTVTMGDGSVHRFKGSADDGDVNKMAEALATKEVELMRVSGEIAGWGDDQISGLWSTIKSAAKGVYRGAQKIASSKAFKWAGKGLLMAAPFAGPFAPAFAAVGGGMTVASQLSDASIAAEAKAKKVANALGLSAKKKSKKAVPAYTGRGWKSTLAWAAKRTKAARARSEGRKPEPKKQAPRRTTKTARAKKKGSSIWRSRARAAVAKRRAQAAVVKRRSPGQRYQPQTAYRPAQPYRPAQAYRPEPFYTPPARPAFPRYASSPYPQPRYTPPWAAQLRMQHQPMGMPQRWN